MRVMGLMSGTSVDGIDVAIAEIEGGMANAALQIRQLAFETIPWPTATRHEIFELFGGATTTAALCRANFKLGEVMAAAALITLARAGLDQTAIDLIGSHGQTLWHDVQAGHVTSTLQMGELAVITARTGVTTVGNFRVADVAVGGQGAPLVSTFDWYLLRPPAHLNASHGGWRAVQNIGGIGNVTFLPPLGVAAAPLAFDTGPGNALIDWAAGQATGGAWQYDVDGQLAAAGRVAPELLDKWLTHAYFSQQPPKTTGRELFGIPLVQRWYAEAQALGLGDNDFVATLTELTAASIADAYARFAPAPLAQIVVGGGGGRNPVLMARLAHQVASRCGRPIEVCTHAALGIDPDAKEALTFALLAYLALHGQPGNVPACTGAQRQQILGQIAPGDNYLKLLGQVVNGN
ncbi:MAG: anhydro-N-acetylmuramic acid kinase [Chloroflexi bacterium]|nr:anhydro-N-acetylmuramic acid kinase [Chloroflexota bacterium]